MGGAVKRLRDGQSKHQTCALTEYVPNDRSAASATCGKNWQSSRVWTLADCGGCPIATRCHGTNVSV